MHKNGACSIKFNLKGHISALKDTIQRYTKVIKEKQQ